MVMANEELRCPRTGLDGAGQDLRAHLRSMHGRGHKLSPTEYDDTIDSLVRVCVRLLDRVEALEARPQHAPPPARLPTRRAGVRETPPATRSAAPSPQPAPRVKRGGGPRRGSLGAAVLDILADGAWRTSGELVRTLQREDLPMKVNSTSVTVTLGRMIKRGHAVRRYRSATLFEYARIDA